MASTAGGRALATAACFFLGLAPQLSLARSQEDSKPEPIPAVDPYTRGSAASLERAGYVSLGPFPWCEGWTTDRLAAELGGIPIVWVETAHLRIGSTLATYKARGDQAEKRLLARELAELEPLLGNSKLSPSKIDPWLRLHLYARRAEAVHALFCRSFGLDPAEFGPAREGGPQKLAPGPHLGLEMKPVLLLCEKRSTLARFCRLVLGRDGTDPIRERLPGPTLFVGLSAETLRSWEQELDLALHAQAATDLALNLVDGFRDNGYRTPLWFKYGWSHVVARGVDERFAFYARSAQREDKNAWRWAPRVQALVANDYAPTFEQAARWARFEDLRGPEHMVSWSKVGWMLEQGPQAMRRWILALTEPLPELKGPELDAHLVQRQLDALREFGGGRDLGAIEADWRAWAAKGGARR
jgi:hypothetical protein